MGILSLTPGSRSQERSSGLDPLSRLHQPRGCDDRALRRRLPRAEDENGEPGIHDLPLRDPAGVNVEDTATPDPYLPIATLTLSGHYVHVRGSTGDLGEQSSATDSLHNWVVNGIISLPYVCCASPGLLGVVLVALAGLGLVETETTDASGLLGSLAASLVWAGLFAFLSARALMRGVVVTSNGLRVRKVFKTRDIAWRDISRINLRVDRGEEQVTWYSPVLEGPAWKMDLPIASSSHPKAARYVTRLNATLAEHRGTRP